MKSQPFVGHIGAPQLSPRHTKETHPDTCGKVFCVAHVLVMQLFPPHPLSIPPVLNIIILNLFIKNSLHVNLIESSQSSNERAK